MPEEEQVVLLSVRPRFAEAILDGLKTAELRRTVPSAAVGSHVVLYASAPAMAVVGVARLARIDSGPPETVWPLAKDYAAVKQDEYNDYFEGARQAAVLWLTDPRRVDEPILLSEIRASGPFQPPQSFRYLRGAELHRFRTLLAHSGTANCLPEDPSVAGQLALDVAPDAAAPVPSESMVLRVLRKSVASSLTMRELLGRPRRAG